MNFTKGITFSQKTRDEFADSVLEFEEVFSKCKSFGAPLFHFCESLIMLEEDLAGNKFFGKLFPHIYKCTIHLVYGNPQNWCELQPKPESDRECQISLIISPDGRLGVFPFDDLVAVNRQCPTVLCSESQYIGYDIKESLKTITGWALRMAPRLNIEISQAAFIATKNEIDLIKEKLQNKPT